jgi:hypothetical protein
MTKVVAQQDIVAGFPELSTPGLSSSNGINFAADLWDAAGTLAGRE